SLCVRAAARLIRTVASTNAGSGFNPLMGKFWTARSVCTPYKASAGTSSVPSGSFSVRVFGVIDLVSGLDDAHRSVEKRIRCALFLYGGAHSVSGIDDGFGREPGDAVERLSEVGCVAERK